VLGDLFRILTEFTRKAAVVFVIATAPTCTAFCGR